VTISMAIGVQRLAKRHALMRRLAAVETLGNTSVICSDKTGTLTKDEMTVRKIFVSSQPLEVSGTGYDPDGQFWRDGQSVTPFAELKDLLQAAALASDAHIVRDEAARRWRVKGDATEGALVVAAAKAKLDKNDLDKRYPRMKEIPFTSETKRMTTLHRMNGSVVAHSKGAPEVIIASCVLGETERDALIETARNMAGEGLRVLAVASKAADSLENAETAMRFLGLIGMMDPPRPEARTAVKKCEEAGIKPVMIT